MRVQIPMSLLCAVAAMPLAQAADYRVAPQMVDDVKAVIATVEPVHQLVARARIGGTVVMLKTREGASVKAGDELALIADQKLTLQIQSMDARIHGLEAQRNQARIDLDRIQELLRRGTATQVAYDQSRTALDVAERALTSMKSDRDVIVQQMHEGAVAAPGAGLVLNVPVSEGTVVMPGETIARLAEEKYILRLQLPERHAQFLRAGDTVQISARGVTNDAPETLKDGTVRIVYPEIQGGRVIADVDVPDLGSYFVSERIRVYVKTGQRSVFLVPRAALFHRAGIAFVKLSDGREVAVQPGYEGAQSIEILSGLQVGDVVSVP